MQLIRFLKHKKARTSTEACIETSAASPSSGFTFVDNSQGASAAVAELSEALDEIIERIDFEGDDLKSQLRSQLGKLEDRASQYRNSQFEEASQDASWSCDRTEAQIISVAWACAAGAYELSPMVSCGDFTVRCQDRLSPSTDGSVKQTTFTVIDHPNPSPDLAAFLPLLVVATRGTKSKVDHMVNLNSEPSSTNGFIDLGQLGLPNLAENEPRWAHSGFLNGARAAEYQISSNIKRLSKKWKVKNLLFTGHSAGGAVSSLLQLRYLSAGYTHGIPAKVSCITFGSPRIARIKIPPCLGSNPRKGLTLNFLNESDLVTRVDKPYVLSLANLLRSMYGLDMLPLSDLDLVGNVKALEADSLASAETDRWEVPQPLYYHVGKRVLLRFHPIQTDQGEEVQLQALRVLDEDISKLLFCRIDIHKRLHYEERIELIAKGAFNGRAEWTHM